MPCPVKAWRFSHYNNVSAQLPIDPKSSQIVVGGVQEQAVQCLKNIKAILESIDVPFDDIVKVTVFLKNLSDLEAVNEVYTRFFPDSGIARAVGYLPARTVVGVAGLPMHALVQMEAVVSHGDGTPPQLVEDRHGLIIEAADAADAPKDALSSQSVAFSHYNNISAQLGIDPATGELVSGGAVEQAEQACKNIKAIIESVGHTMEDAVKANIYLRDLEDMDALEDVYAKYFVGTPARRVVGVSSLPKDALACRSTPSSATPKERRRSRSASCVESRRPPCSRVAALVYYQGSGRPESRRRPAPIPGMFRRWVLFAGTTRETPRSHGTARRFDRA